MITHIITDNFVIGFKHMVSFIGYVLQVMAVEMTDLSYHWLVLSPMVVNTLRTGDANLHFYITTAQDGWRKSAFLTHACFTCTIHLIMQYMEPVSEWSCWRMFIETWPHSELNRVNVHLNNLKAPSSMC